MYNDSTHGERTHMIKGTPFKVEADGLIVKVYLAEMPPLFIAVEDKAEAYEIEDMWNDIVIHTELAGEQDEF
jgi:hypothetical protein